MEILYQGKKLFFSPSVELSTVNSTQSRKGRGLSFKEDFKQMVLTPLFPFIQFEGSF